MGKKQVRVIVVRKPATVALLVLVSALMSALLFYLSGKAYTNEDEPLRRLLLHAMQRQSPIKPDALLAGLMPVIANILFFVPWGILAFLLFDSPSRARSRTYLITVLSGVVFAIALAIWQSSLPTRVTGPLDISANALGALIGAIAGHVRKRVHVQFDY